MQSFLRTAFRVFKKDKVFTFINVLGLTLGIVSAIIIFLVVRQEMSFDKFHTNLERIYRVNGASKRGNGMSFLNTTPAPMAAALKEALPEVAQSTITYYRRGGKFVAEVGGEKREFEEEAGVALVEPQFFEIFTYPVLAGDPASLNVPGNTFLSESIAKKFFKTDDALSTMGSSIRLDDTHNLTVAGIVKDFPANTDFPFTILISPQTFKEQLNLQAWDRIDTSLNTYLLLANQADTTGLKAKLDTISKKNTNPFFASLFSYQLQPFSEVHFDSRYSNYNSRTISDATVAGMIALGVFLLLTACINFINLATANAMKRSKEVGIKKLLGSPAKVLIGQFMGETTLLAATALLISLPLAYVLKPYIEELIGFSFEFTLFSDPVALLFIVALMILVVLISGLYPALTMARFKPSDAIRSGLAGKSGKGSYLRRVLVIFQFFVSQLMIIGLLVIFSQMSYFIDKDLGFAREGVINVPMPRGKHMKGKTLKDELLKIPGVSEVSLANGSPTSRSRWVSSYDFDGAEPNTPYLAEVKYGDLDYIDMYQLPLIAGRKFLADDTVREIIVSRKMTQEMGLANPEDALSKKLILGENISIPIVGVVEDFHTSSLRDPLRASYIATNPDSFREAGVKLNMENSEETIKQIETAWTEIFPEEPFTYQFLDETIRSFYQAEQRLTKIIALFTMIAIVIGCLGLYGLVSFVANQRQKEIGIRKVLGANTVNIFYIISREFIILVIVAFTIAAPLAYHYAGKWLDGFEYRVVLDPAIFIYAIAASVLIALLSVSYKAVSASQLNPTEVLRTE